MLGSIDNSRLELVDVLTFGLLLPVVCFIRHVLNAKKAVIVIKGPVVQRINDRANPELSLNFVSEKSFVIVHILFHRSFAWRSKIKLNLILINISTVPWTNGAHQANISNCLYKTVARQ